MNKTAPILVAFGIAVATQNALAQGGPPSFSQLNADGNASLSVAELGTLFERMQQFGIAPAESAEAFFSQLDSNG
jgi:hypothetical protein